LMFYHLGDATANLSNEWRVARTWPPPATPLPLYLQADGTASFTAPTTAMAVCTFAYHPTNPAPSIGGGFGYGVTNGFMDQRPLTNRADVLRFVTAPLSVPLDIVGTPRVELRFSTDVPDSLFVVKLLDIYPDGFEGILTESACMAIQPLMCIPTALRKYGRMPRRQPRITRFMSARTRRHSWCSRRSCRKAKPCAP